jgi:hypothetical protein
MKPIIKSHAALLMVVCCLFSNTSFSQSLKSVFTDSESPLLYLGIDFTQARLLDGGNPQEIRDNYFISINQLIVNEPDKYNLKKAFRKSNIEHDFDAIAKNNAQVNVNDILSTKSGDFNRLKEADIATIINALDLGDKQGTGLVFVMEAMKKASSKSEASVWVTFVDIKNKKVLMTERMECDVIRGIGFRNYWGSTIKTLIDTIDKKKFNEWKSKYGN